MASIQILVLATALCFVLSQRPPYAGRHPIGFPEVEKPSNTANQFGGINAGPTERLPLEAGGDRELVERLRKLPIDQQPFWLINWQALEANRQNPKTYSISPNIFLEDPKPHYN